MPSTDMKKFESFQYASGFPHGHFKFIFFSIEDCTSFLTRLGGAVPLTGEGRVILGSVPEGDFPKQEGKELSFVAHPAPNGQFAIHFSSDQQYQQFQKVIQDYERCKYFTHGYKGKSTGYFSPLLEEGFEWIKKYEAVLAQCPMNTEFYALLNFFRPDCLKKHLLLERFDQLETRKSFFPFFQKSWLTNVFKLLKDTRSLLDKVIVEKKIDWISFQSGESQLILQFPNSTDRDDFLNSLGGSVPFTGEVSVLESLPPQGDFPQKVGERALAFYAYLTDEGRVAIQFSNPLQYEKFKLIIGNYNLRTYFTHSYREQACVAHCSPLIQMGKQWMKDYIRLSSNLEHIASLFNFFHSCYLNKENLMARLRVVKELLTSEVEDIDGFVPAGTVFVPMKRSQESEALSLVMDALNVLSGSRSQEMCPIAKSN